MTGRKTLWRLSLVLALALVSTSYGAVVGSFEGDLDGWYNDTATLSLGTTGATAGTQALQVGSRRMAAAHQGEREAPSRLLALKGVKITADVTAFAADMTTTWMQVGMVLNCQNNNDERRQQQPRLERPRLSWTSPATDSPTRYTWVLSDAVTAKIAGADDTIGWFEFLLISNVDAASVVKFYIDNIQIVGLPWSIRARAPTPSSATGNRTWTAGSWAATPTFATATSTA